MMNTFSCEVIHRHAHTKARITRVTTPHGEFITPVFMPVGTRAGVNNMTPPELHDAGSQIILGGNTYHMLCAPGMDVIEQALFAKKISRLVIAQGQAAKVGHHADIKDIYTPIRQLNSPVWVNGQLDLRRFQNKYPPVAKGRGILKKIPAQQGRVGFTVTAERMEPGPPQDLDLSVFAGAGTSIEVTAEGDILVAAMDGYICWDAATKKISIT